MEILNVTLNRNDMGSGITLSNGNLTTTISTLASGIRATHGRSTGKWYWEAKLDSGNRGSFIGVSNNALSMKSISYNSLNWRSVYSGGAKYPEVTSYGKGWEIGDIIGVALDLDNGTLEFYKNGSSMGISHTNVKELGEVYPILASGVQNSITVTFNFGLAPFSYQIPHKYYSYDGRQYGYAYKSLIHHNSTYKHYINNQWHSLPSPPTEQDYLDYGMDDLSIIPESAWQELEGDVELCYYTDNPNKNEASFNITTTPFTLAEEWEDKTISVIEYTDDPNQTESSITLETEPFTIYDELGDEVDVLYYTDDPDKTEAKLNITANYSPLDELEGDFDVVTYSEDLSEGDTLALSVNALPVGQLVIAPQSFAYLGEIRSFISHLINSNNVGIIRFIISFDNGATWKSYSKGLDQWKNVNIISPQNVIKDGMRYQTFNTIPEHQIKAQPNGNIKLAYYIEETKHLNQPIGIDYISYRSLVPQEDIKFNDVAFYVLNTTATIDLQFGGNKLTGTLSDEDLTKVQYRVLLNGEPYHPRNGEFTRLNAPPVNISLNINERDIIFEKENVIRVEFKDSWGETDFWEPPPFIGTYSGIMFKDEKGKYLSNSFGDILRNLEFGDIIAGQTTLEQKVIVKNQMGVQVQNLILNVMKDKLPEGVRIELSRTNNPFVAEDPLLFNMFFNPDDEFTLYVRISTDLEAPANPNGEFEVRANADPV